MNYQETLDYLFSRLPMYQRIGAAAYKANLDNTHALMDILQHPETGFKSVHVAGTNGKGSVCHMLASIFQTAGYKTGLYTSPHLIDFRERIKINGQMITEHEVIRFVEQYASSFSKIEPSFFEWTMALAFDYFRNQKVDIAIVETGLGGRLDSTNVVAPEVSLITNIGYDHMQFLGETLAEIAAEKAGIIKPNVPVVIGEKKEETESVFRNKAKQCSADIHFSEDVEFNNTLNTDLKGEHQSQNMHLVYCAMEVLKKQGLSISPDHIRSGFQNVVHNTGLMGRWQMINNQPLTICDVAHNAEGIKFVLHEIKRLKFNRLHIVWSMVNDKNTSKVLSMLPKDANYYFTSSSVPRSMKGKELKDQASQLQLDGVSFENSEEAFAMANKSSHASDFIFIGGSTFLVGDILKALSNS